MSQNYIEEKTFNKINFTQNLLQMGEYESCIFKGCDLSNVDLSNYLFIECTFENCNLSMVTLNMTTFNDIFFKDCKMLGLHFENCNDIGFTASFEECNLEHSSFYKIKLQNSRFTNLKLHNVDFTDCDLSNITFQNCDFSGAVFDNTILKNADLRTSFNYSIDPEKNNIKQAKFSLSGVTGLLEKYDIVVDNLINQI